VSAIIIVGKAVAVPDNQGIGDSPNWIRTQLITPVVGSNMKRHVSPMAIGEMNTGMVKRSKDAAKLRRPVEHEREDQAEQKLKSYNRDRPLQGEEEATLEKRVREEVRIVAPAAEMTGRWIEQILDAEREHPSIEQGIDGQSHQQAHAREQEQPGQTLFSPRPGGHSSLPSVH
jgi:hypothetical protein